MLLLGTGGLSALGSATSRASGRFREANLRAVVCGVCAEGQYCSKRGPPKVDVEWRALCEAGRVWNAITSASSLGRRRRGGRRTVKKHYGPSLRRLQCNNCSLLKRRNDALRGPPGR